MKNLVEIKKRAKDAFGEIEGVRGFGVGEGTIRVYLEEEDEGASLPEEFEGVPLEIVLVGDVGHTLS